jgi:chloramphenicol O-acetyltransferase
MNYRYLVNENGENFFFFLIFSITLTIIKINLIRICVIIRTRVLSIR